MFGGGEIRIRAAAATLNSDRASRLFMATDNVVQLLDAELVQTNNLCVSTKRRRHQVTSFVFAVHRRDDPRTMAAIHASPICVRQQMGTGREKDLNSSHTGLKIGLVPNFDEIAFHTENPPQQIFRQSNLTDCPDFGQARPGYAVAAAYRSSAAGPCSR